MTRFLNACRTMCGSFRDHPITPAVRLFDARGTRLSGRKRARVTGSRAREVARSGRRTTESASAQRAQDRYESARKCLQGDSKSCEGASQQGQPQLPQGTSAATAGDHSRRASVVSPDQPSPFVQPPAGGNSTIQQAQLMQTDGFTDDQLSSPLSGNPLGFNSTQQSLGGGGGDVVPFATDSISEWRSGARCSERFRINRQRADQYGGLEILELPTIART